MEELQTKIDGEWERNAELVDAEKELEEINKRLEVNKEIVIGGVEESEEEITNPEKDNTEENGDVEHE